MRLPAGRCIVGGVAEALPIVLRMEIDRAEEPISGRLTPESGGVVSFTGWVGLAAAIEEVRRSGRTGPSRRREKLRDDPS